MGVYEDTQIKMGTVMTIKAYGDKAKEAVVNAFKRVDEIEQLTSTNISSSEVAKINEAAGKEYISVHPDVFYIIKKSIEYSKISNGSFDITVGPIVKLWNFGTEEARVPSTWEINEKLPLIGYEKIRLNESKLSVKLENEGMAIDLGGIAKGYAADEIMDILKEHGIRYALINLGGSTIYTLGSKPGGENWSVGIQHPRKDRGEGYLGIVMASNKAIATSGDYQRYIMKNGKRYHHILDPLTGYPSESGIMSDTIVLEGDRVQNPSMFGDALSTAVFVLGPLDGLRLIEGIEGVECIITLSDFSLIASSGMRDKIKSISKEFRYDAQGR